MVGKMQDYDNVVLGFQPLLGFNHATSFTLTLIFEGLFAAMIIMGFGTRLSALLMTLVSAIAIVEAFFSGEITSPSSKLEFVYMGIFLTLVISGGGKYAMSRAIMPDKSVPKR